MNEGATWDELWKLPEDLKERVVKGKTPATKKEGEISYQIAKTLNRLETHREMRLIANQIHPSTQYKPFNKAISAYLKSSQETRDKVCAGKIHIMDLVEGEEEVKELAPEDRKNIVRYNNAKEVQSKLNLFYKDLKFFLEGTPEDREYLRTFLKADKINYIASLLACIRDEKLLQSFIKYQGIREVL